MTTQKWAEALARELLRSYCGHQTDLSGMTVEQQNEALLDHVVNCPKRPELKFLSVCLAAAKLVEDFDNRLMKLIEQGEVHMDDWHHFEEDIDNIRGALDELKPKPEEVRP